MRAGANIAGSIYQPHITSYDYDCPISEAGGIGQPGIGGDNKFKVRLHFPRRIPSAAPESASLLSGSLGCPVVRG